MFRDAFCQICYEWNLSSDVLKTLHAFTCKLYASRTPDTDVNDLRFSPRRAKKGLIDSGQLLPCEDTLNQQAWRANYQSAIWRWSLEAKPSILAQRMAMDGEEQKLVDSASVGWQDFLFLTWYCHSYFVNAAVFATLV